MQKTVKYQANTAIGTAAAALARLLAERIKRSNGQIGVGYENAIRNGGSCARLDQCLVGRVIGIGGVRKLLMLMLIMLSTI